MGGVGDAGAQGGVHVAYVMCICSILAQSLR